MRKIDVVCEECNVIFQKNQKEANRSLKINRKQYCSRRCAGKNAIEHLKNYPRYDISKHKFNRIDEFTGFREFIRRARTRGFEINITVEYIKTLWNEQEGRCAYTKILLSIPSYNKRNDSIKTASLDRIDSSLGYVVGNVQFVSMIINYMKSRIKTEEIKELIKIIKET